MVPILPQPRTARRPLDCARSLLLAVEVIFSCSLSCNKKPAALSLQRVRFDCGITYAKGINLLPPLARTDSRSRARRRWQGVKHAATITKVCRSVQALIAPAPADTSPTNAKIGPFVGTRVPRELGAPIKAHLP